MAFANTTKNVSSYSRDSKNAAAYSRDSKNVSSYSRDSKNASSYSRELSALFKEDGFFLTKEDGGKILLEPEVINNGKSSSSYTYENKNSS